MELFSPFQVFIFRIKFEMRVKYLAKCGQCNEVGWLRLGMKKEPK